MTKIKLGDVAFEYKGKLAGATKSVGLEHLSQGDVDLLGYDEGGDNTFTKAFKEGQVLFGRRRAYLKKASVAPFEGVCSGDIICIEAKEGLLSSRLLPFVIQNDNLFDFAVENSAGSLSPRVKWSSLAEYEFNLPDMRKQEELAELLWAAQELKRQYKKLLSANDEIVKSRFIEMFGDETEFGKWPVGRIEDIADVTVGVVIKPTQYYVEEGGVKAFRSLNVKPMKINDDDWVHFSEEGNLKNCKSMLHTGDVLIVRSGYPGTSCVVEPEYDGCNAVDLIIAKPNKAIVNPYFLCAFNNYPHGQSRIKQGTGGAAQQHFNVGKYKAMSIPLPPLELQNEFVEFAQQVDKSGFALKQAIVDLGSMMSALLNEELGLGNV